MSTHEDRTGDHKLQMRVGRDLWEASGTDWGVNYRYLVITITKASVTEI